MRKFVLGVLASLSMALLSIDARAQSYTWYSSTHRFQAMDPHDRSVTVSSVVLIQPMSAARTRVTVRRTDLTYVVIDFGGQTPTWFWGTPAPIHGDIASVMVAMLRAYQEDGTRVRPPWFSHLWVDSGGSNFLTATIRTQLRIDPAIASLPPLFPYSGLRGGTLDHLTILDGGDVFGFLGLIEPPSSRDDQYDYKTFWLLRSDAAGRQLTPDEAGRLFAAATTSRGVWLDNRRLVSENGRKLILHGIRWQTFQ